MKTIYRHLENENIYAVYVKAKDTLIINTNWNGIDAKIHYIDY